MTIKRPGFLLLGILFLIARAPHQAWAHDSMYYGNFIVPEMQSGFQEEEYEIIAGKKLLRGVENFFLSPLEITHGIKTERAYRRAEYLPVGIDTFFVGAFRGAVDGAKRAAVGVYEMTTFAYAQDPILSEYSEWLY